MGEPQKPDNADLQGDEPQDAPGTDEPGADPTSPPDEGGEGDAAAAEGAKGWSKEGQAIFTKMSQKLADAGKSTDAKLDALAEMIQQQTGTRPATPPKSASAQEKAATVERLNDLVKETPAFKEMRQAQLNTVASMPEKFVTGVRPAELEAITPALREAVAKYGYTDPATITAMAKSLAYDVSAKKLTVSDEAATKAKEAKRVALEKQRPLDSSAGAEGGSGEISYEQTDALLDELDVASQSGTRDPDIHI